MGKPVAPVQPWTWAVELPDGQRIVGTGPLDLLERWGRTLGWLAGAPLPVEDVAAAIVRHAARYGDLSLRDWLAEHDATMLPHRDELAAGFLRALADTGLATLYRKDV